jgi:hypothetical protein
MPPSSFIIDEDDGVNRAIDEYGTFLKGKIKNEERRTKSFWNGVYFRRS